jgi:8-demethyl-8-alpha-L-rhamnosyltetracenomycin-C 2'-O-methyltransferase
MKTLVKRAVGWHGKSDAEKASLWKAIELAKYKAKLVLALILSPIPFALQSILSFTGTDKHQPSGHLYGNIYARYFGKFRYRRTNILEIGIGGYAYSVGGPSLIAWRAFFPFARITGCDLHPRPGMDSPLVHIRRLDQSNADELDNIAKAEGPFDIIIDDGSHQSEHQILTFLRLFPALNDGGVYVVEDVMTSYWHFDGWDGADLGDARFDSTCMAWFTRLSHYVNHDEFETLAGADAEMLKLAPFIGHILFTKNIIIIEKDLGSKGAVSIDRLKAAAQARAGK